MSTIVAILRAAHCKSTHHYFAIDALETVLTPQGRQLAGMLLAHYGDYLLGAKAPDNVFKDFENHVLHVRDGYWGGAATAAEKWLEKSHAWLAIGNWKEASYSIGVLSHYFTDPFMPCRLSRTLNPIDVLYCHRIAPSSTHLPLDLKRPRDSKPLD